ncbi:MAG: hypothetical protein P4N24_10795 [Acidobacteriota bacterium]|nr:hypothetical protein [Acidobacteriota bacterium]
MNKENRSTSQMTRQSFLKATALLPLAALHPGQADAAPQQDATGDQRTQPKLIQAGNAHFRFDLTAGHGLKTGLVHAPSSLELAEGEYSYSFGTPLFAEASSHRTGDVTTVDLVGNTGTGIEIHQKFRIPDNKPWIEEEVIVGNRSPHPLALSGARCGFVLPLKVGANSVESGLKDFKFTAVPYRREPAGNRTQYADYTLFQVLTQARRSNLRARIPVSQSGNIVTARVSGSGIVETLYPQYASEGWVLTDGRRGFLLTKYCQEGMEWALLDSVPMSEERVGLRWGGCGIFQGDPENGAGLAPQSSHRFGVSRITAFEGGIEEGYYAFRAEMESRGHGCPQGFNPPVHWNELYDNKLWWLPGGGSAEPEKRKQFYTLDSMKEEAAKARDIGCEALYLDPGWDTRMASKIWDEPRLGRLKDFTAMLRRDYGLGLSLHAPLSGWCDPSTYSREMDRMNPDGSRVELSLCGASRQYVDESLARFLALARDGAIFFMFDGTAWAGECWDPHHGHPVPSRREDHVAATNRLACLVHSQYPEVLIEMHDQILGGTYFRYVPTYYGHGKCQLDGAANPTHGFDTVWAFELMWDPMTDLVGGHSIALYYYNLAYSLPLYIHIDLRKDNAQCLMFWWNASTCRHLGIGGTHTDPAVRKSQKEAMAAYRRLAPVFKSGTFYGLGETVHVHVHPSKSEAVINCFNLENKPASKRVEFAPSRYGLDVAKEFKVVGATANRHGESYLLEVDVPAYGHSLIELR